MMTKQIQRYGPLLILGALVGCAQLSTEQAQASADEATAGTVERSVLVTYACGDRSDEPLQAEYGLVGAVPVVALVHYDGQLSPLLQRVIEDRSANVFIGEGVVWITDVADGDALATVSGRALLQQVNQGAAGPRVAYDQITQDCRVVAVE